MNLDDYINQHRKSEQERAKLINNTRRWVTFFPNIDTYSSIPQEKISLIKDFGKYIESYKYNYTPNRKNVMIQVKTTDNNSMAAMIENREAVYTEIDAYGISEISEEYYNKCIIEGFSDVSGYSRELTSHTISEEEYYRRLNQFQLVGSQEFAVISLDKIKYDNGYKYCIFYTSDGHTFICDWLADYLIQKISAPTLGNYLAEEAIKIKQKIYPY